MSVQLQGRELTEGFQPSLHYGFRSYPLGTSLDLRLAQAWRIWGRPEQGPWYGFFRPSAEGSTALSYNALSAQLEFFPVSFLGLRSGIQSADNRRDYTAYDCETHRCRGRLYRNFVELEMAVGYRQFFALTQLRQESLKAPAESTKRFVDPALSLSIDPTGEEVFRSTLILGMNWSPSFRIMLLDRRAHIVGKTDSYSKTQMALISTQRGPWTLSSGLGAFWGELNPKNLSFIFGANYYFQN